MFDSYHMPISLTDVLGQRSEACRRPRSDERRNGMELAPTGVGATTYAGGRAARPLLGITQCSYGEHVTYEE